MVFRYCGKSVGVRLDGYQTFLYNRECSYRMTMQQWEEQLKTDGFNQVTEHKDPPGYEYPDHSHPVDTAHVVLKGSMRVWFDGREHIVKDGGRLDVGKHTIHKAKIGPDGCTFLIGVRM